jgi:hypothetical protein
VRRLDAAFLEAGGIWQRPTDLVVTQRAGGIGSISAAFSRLKESGVKPPHSKDAIRVIGRR